MCTQKNDDTKSTSLRGGGVCGEMVVVVVMCVRRKEGEDWSPLENDSGLTALGDSANGSI